jgi:hypothetical protein
MGQMAQSMLPTKEEALSNRKNVAYEDIQASN